MSGGEMTADAVMAIAHRAALAGDHALASLLRAFAGRVSEAFVRTVAAPYLNEETTR